MASPVLFGDVLEAADQLTMDEKETLIEILRKRMAEIKRQELIARVQESRRDFEAGNYRVATPQEIMNEILS